MAELLGSLLVELGMNSAEFDRGVEKAKGNIRAMAKSFGASTAEIEAAVKASGLSVQRFASQVNALQAEVNPAGVAMTALRERVLFLQQAFKVGAISQQQFAQQVRAASQQYRAATMTTNQTSGQAQAGMQQLSFQLSDVATQWSMGTRPMQIFAQQSGQVVQAIALMSQGAGRFGAFMAGPWGMALTAGIVVLGSLISSLDKTSTALDQVKFSTSAVSEVQGILGNVMDMTTGKITTQTSALIALARAQLLVAKVQSIARGAEARRGVQAIQSRPVEASGGLGGGVAFRRRPMDARDAISRDVLGGRLDAGTAVGRMENLRNAGVLTDAQFTEGASAIANLAVEEANQKVYDEGLKLLDGKGGRSLLTPKTGGKKSRERKAKTGPSQEEINRAFQAERAGFMQQYNSAMASMALDAEKAADFEMRNVELQRIRTIDAIKHNKDYSDGQKKELIAQAEELAEVEREQVEFEKKRRLEQESLAAAQDEHDRQKEALGLKLQMAGTDKERQTIALEMLALDQKFRRNALEQIIASETRTAAEKALAQKALDGLNQVEAAERAAAAQGTQTRAQAYLSSLQRTPAQINEAIENIKVDALESFNDQLVDAIVNFRSLGDVAQAVLKQILADLIRLQLQQSLMPFLASALGLGIGAGVSAGGGGVGAGLSALAAGFGGARAKGGPVKAGLSYLVGERGPEIFSPGRSGRIVSNDNLAKMGGGASTTHSPTFVFPGITNPNQAREAAGQAARRYRQEINGPLRGIQ